MFKMEANVSLEKVLDESFSKKEVTFCDKSSILYYAVDGTVNSLNDNIVHTISNDNFPLSADFSNMLQDSFVDSHAEYASAQYLGNLPEATVVLERLPEALVHEHTYSKNFIENGFMSNVPQNTDKACSLKSDSSHLRKPTELIMNQTTSELKKNQYQLQNLKVSILKLPYEEIVSKTCSAIDAYSESSNGKPSKIKNIVNNVQTKSRNISIQLLDCNPKILQQSFLQNSSAKLPPSKEIETSEFLGKKSTEGKDKEQFVDSNASACIVNQMKFSEVSFDKYPCIHLEKLNLESYLCSIANSSKCLQSKKDIPKDLQLQVENTMNASGVSVMEETLPIMKNINPKIGLSVTEKTLPVIEEVRPKTDHSAIEKTLALIEKIGAKIGLSIAQKTLPLNEESPKTLPLNEESPKTLPLNEESPKTLPLNEGSLKTLPLNEESPKTSNLSPLVIDIEDDLNSSEVIFPEEIHSTKSKLCRQDLSTDNLSKVASNDNSVVFDYENSLSGISFSQDKNIVNDANYNDSSLYKNIKGKFPVVLLERLNLSLPESDTSYDVNFTESVCSNLVPTVTNVPELPIRIENVCSISKENFNGMPKHRKKPSKNSFNTKQKLDKKSSGEIFIDKFNENGFSIIKPKSNVCACVMCVSNISNISSEDTISDNFIINSEDSLSENDLPLIMLSKQKFNLPHSEDSSNDIPLISPKTSANLTLTTKAKNSHVKSCKPKKKNYTNGTVPLLNLAKTSASVNLAPKSKNSYIKSVKQKKKNSIHNILDCSAAAGKINSKSKMSYNTSNKMTKKKFNKSVELLSSEKKKTSKKSLRRKQLKVYKMIKKYLKMQIKSKKHKKKSKKRKNPQEKSTNLKLESSNNESDTDSTLTSESLDLIYDSVEKDHSYAQNENSLKRKSKKSVQCKKVRHCECSSTSERVKEHSYAQSKTFAKKACCGESSASTSAKRCHKSVDKYRLGFLSNKFSLRFYNRFLASERLLLSKCKLRKNKKKEVKRLFTMLKAVGLMSLK